MVIIDIKAPSAILVVSIVPVKFVPSQTKPTCEAASTPPIFITTVWLASLHVPDTAKVAESVVIFI